jgi:hypothetical protein
MKGATWNSTVIARGELQIVFSLAVTNASKFFTADHKLAGISLRFLLPVPTRLFRIPGHNSACRTTGVSGGRQPIPMLEFKMI